MSALRAQIVYLVGDGVQGYRRLAAALAGRPDPRAFAEIRGAALEVAALFAAAQRELDHAAGTASEHAARPLLDAICASLVLIASAGRLDDLAGLPLAGADELGRLLSDPALAALAR